MERSWRILAAATVAAFVGVGAARADDADAHLPMESRSEVLLPPNSDGLAWRYDMKMGDFSGSCAGLVYELHTPELIERRVKEMLTAGFNTVCINGLHMHHCFLDRWPLVTKYVTKVAEVAHRHEMRVVFHHDVPVILYNGRGLQHMLAHADWLARDIEHDRPTLRCYCIVNPEFRASYFARMERFARETGIDGVMLDEACFAGKSFCGCQHCRGAFTRETGCVLPRENDSEVFYNKDNPVWIEWLKWRKRVVGDWWVAMRKVFTGVRRDFCIMTYTTHYGFSGNWASTSFGSDIFEVARGCDFLGAEIMARNVYDSYRAVYAFRKAKAGLGDHYGVPIWGLVYHVQDPVMAYFGWAMNHMNRQTSWMTNIAGEDMRRYLDWPQRMRSRFARPMSDVAIAFTGSARDFPRMFSPSSDPLGVAQCLADVHIQFDFVVENDLLDKGRLQRYKILVLASLGVLSSAQAETIRQYVAEGGALLTTTNASLLNGIGFKQDNFQLADVMGVDYGPASFIRGPGKIRAREDGAVVTVPGASVRVKAREGAEIVAELLNSKGEAFLPAIVANRYGRGRCAYAAFALGAANWETEWGVGRKMTFEKDRPLADLLVRLIRNTASGAFDVAAVQVPEKVLVNVCRQDVGGREAVLVHLLNATGAGVKKGETVPLHKDWAKHGLPFPAVQEDLVLDVRTPGDVARAYVVSPDYEGERPVATAPVPDGRIRVTVAKADLQAYAIVYLELGPKAEQP